MFDDAGSESRDRDAHVFGTVHRGVQVEIFDVYCHEFGSWGGDDTVEEAFGGGHAGCWSADFAGIVDEIATDGEADAMRV